MILNSLINDTKKNNKISHGVALMGKSHEKGKRKRRGCRSLRMRGKWCYWGTGKMGIKVDPSGGVTKKVIVEKKKQAPFLGQDHRGSMKWGGYAAHVGRTLLEYPFLWYQRKRKRHRSGYFVVGWGKQVDKCMGFDFSPRQPLLNTRGRVINEPAVSS